MKSPFNLLNILIIIIILFLIFSVIYFLEGIIIAVCILFILMYIKMNKFILPDITKFKFPKF
jgi:hypothetical protein